MLAIAFCGATAQAQSWHRPAKPHENSRYFNSRGSDFNRKKSHHFKKNDSGYDDVPVAFEVGLVTKRYGTRLFGGGRHHENLWGEHNKFLNGVQFGISLQPTWDNNFGFRTGIFYELYVSNSSAVQMMGYNRFTEHDLYVPLQAVYHIETASPLCIDVSTGFGFNVAMAGVYRSWGREGCSHGQKYGNYLNPGESIVDTDNWPWRAAETGGFSTMNERVDEAIPDRVNAMWEIGVSVRYDHFKAGMNYGLGLNDQEFYEHARTRQNKFTFSLGVVF